MTGAAASTTSPVTKTSTGAVIGERSGDMLVYRGIPYAAPPVGPLRWRAPQPVKAWTAPRQATAFGPVCPQMPAPAIGGVSADVAQSEDCLTLNIWAPAGAAGLPVAVWIHGGANRIGAGSLPAYDGSTFARDGVVFVSFNYRLGHLGWFAPKALQAEAGKDAFGNYGLLDQIALLRWVKANIAAFGGDPDRVTIFGESAGGAAVLNLLASPLAKGLFQRAIAQSPGGLDDPLSPEAKAQESAQVIAESKLPGDATAAQLRALAPQAFFSMTGGLSLRPVIDGVSLKEGPGAALAGGRAARVPLMIGANSAEGYYTDENTGKIILAGLGGDVARARELYAGLANDDLTLAREFIGDSIFVAPARQAARLGSANQPVYLYHFDYTPEALRALAPGGTRHGGEIPFVFDRLTQLMAVFGQTPSPADAAKATETHGIWVSFIKDGAPKAADGWLPYQAGSDRRYVFGATSMFAPVERAAILDWHHSRTGTPDPLPKQ